MDEPKKKGKVNYSTPEAPLGVPDPLTAKESKEKLTEAISDSNELLASATTVLRIFPDTLAVDRTKITVTKRSFFSAEEVMSMRIEDILNVTANLGPFFGSIKILSRVFTNDMPYTVGPFWQKDTQKLKRIIQGYVIAKQRKIDCSQLPTKELAAMLDKLGQDAPAQ